jgi:ketosteroid isomerase-like protein
MPDDETRAAVLRFDDAINRHDLDALSEAMTDDVVFEDTSPPDGTPSSRR